MVSNLRTRVQVAMKKSPHFVFQVQTHWVWATLACRTEVAWLSLCLCGAQSGAVPAVTFRSSVSHLYRARACLLLRKCFHGSARPASSWGQDSGLTASACCLCCRRVLPCYFLSNLFNSGISSKVLALVMIHNFRKALWIPWSEIGLSTVDLEFNR